MSGHDFDTVICGGGPAGLGPVVAASVSRQLGQLLGNGVRILERSSGLGAGALRGYAIGGNSLGGAFLECLEETERGLLDDVACSEQTKCLRCYEDRYPPLPAVAAFLDRLGRTVHRLFERSPNSDVSLGATVDEVRLLPEGGAVVASSHDVPGGRRRELTTASNVLLTCGGKPRPDASRVALSTRISLERWSEKVVHAEDLIRRDVAIPERLSDAIHRNPRAVIIGNSHGAWSAACRILNDPSMHVRIGRPQVCIITRRSTRLAYLSARDAHLDGYRFDPGRDICPRSGRVNRFSGLRGEAFRLGRQVMLAGEEGRARLRLLSVEDIEEVVKSLNSAALIISAVGFDASFPRLLDAEGRPMRILRYGSGPAVSESAHLLDARWRPVPSLVVYGLGSGLMASPRIGGEPSYRGRLDGVWLYQHDVGRVALDRILYEAGNLA